jgi:hypothetical protein
VIEALGWALMERAARGRWAVSRRPTATQLRVGAGLLVADGDADVAGAAEFGAD